VFLKRTLTLIALVGLASVAMAAADSMTGTWKLNVAKSKASPYKSATTVAETVGDALKVTVDAVGNDDTAYHWTWAAKYDGKDVPVEGKTILGDKSTAALTRIDANTAKVVSKRDGKVVMTQTITTSADGKSRTIIAKGVDAKGHPVDWSAVYDKQ
jgi:hypothetical protein